ncbi:MAG: hypothetical protein MJK04_35955, partial [Psychrosphaera sp.]|nr:hypothetical protein [Psychrosphaera sp.]
TPIIDIPLWVWRGNANPSPSDVWQLCSTQPIKSWYINADHYAILDQPALAEQLIENLNQHQPLKAETITES